MPVCEGSKEKANFAETQDSTGLRRLADRVNVGASGLSCGDAMNKSDDATATPPVPVDGNGVAVDPRRMITPDAFRVSEQLYGLPLAGPWRRLAAILIDAGIVGLISQAGGLLLGLALGLMGWAWWITRKAPEAPLPARVRRVLRLAAAVVALGVVLSLLDVPSGEYALFSEQTETTPGQSLDLSPADGVSFAAQLAGFVSCSDAPCRRARFPAVIEAAGRSRTSVEEQREVLAELAGSAADDADEVAALMTLVDGRAADSAPPAVKSAPQATPDFAERMLKALHGIVDEVGENFGWGAVYFTLVTVYWRGQTLGKRWMGIRVVVLNGRPISIAAAFERYGGYAAGLATGLLGFLQVFWDPNRQAIHDRIAFTAVIRLRGASIPSNGDVS
ncbi:RDD family protein [Sinimarinibacterium sp. CAU 1509]|uniref:RDD family protein n=1 Tax=Sinimarinibacterium sp. CAU 1509 TaxID=2562283 RepID=UPI001B7FD79B|nr:RDD family protein [Sinimarinibacterium sp. CAU 1509]